MLCQSLLCVLLPSLLCLCDLSEMMIRGYRRLRSAFTQKVAKARNHLAQFPLCRSPLCSLRYLLSCPRHRFLRWRHGGKKEAEPVKVPPRGGAFETPASFAVASAGWRYGVQCCCFSRARRSTRRILPLAFFGSSATNSISRGYLNGAIARLQCCWSSSFRSSLGW